MINYQWVVLFFLGHLNSSYQDTLLSDFTVYCVHHCLYCTSHHHAILWTFCEWELIEFLGILKGEYLYKGFRILCTGNVCVLLIVFGCYLVELFADHWPCTVLYIFWMKVLYKNLFVKICSWMCLEFHSFAEQIVYILIGSI